MLTFSHNHCGPRLRDDLHDYYPVDEQQEALVAEYSDLVRRVTVDAVGRALGSLVPARLSAGEGEAGFAVNRRNNVEKDVPAILASGGSFQEEGVERSDQFECRVRRGINAELFVDSL